MSAKTILMEAQRLLRDVGVCKGALSYMRDDGSAMAYCTIGAFREAYRFSNGDYNSYYTATNLLRKVIGENNVATWNDAKERTRSEILNAFAEAIVLAEQKEEREANNG